MGVVIASLTVEVHGWIRPFAISGRERLLVMLDVTEALLSCLWLQQGGIHGEVLIRKQVALTGLFERGDESC